MDFVYIYTLSHPLTGVVRYVGKTNNLKKRASEHRRDKYPSKKMWWIRSLQAKGLTANMEVLDIVPETSWQFWEQYWISQLKTWGILLYNGDNGGQDSTRFSTNLKNTLSKSLKGKTVPNAWVPYHQYTLEGKYLQTFPSLGAAAQFVACDGSSLAESAREGFKSMGFLWTKGRENPLPQIQTKYISGGSIKRTPEELQEIKDKQNKTRQLNNHPRKVVGESTKQLLSIIGKGRGISPEQKLTLIQRNAKKVSQFSLNGSLVKVWDSIKEASETLNIPRNTIAHSLRNPQSIPFKHPWCWKYYANLN